MYTLFSRICVASQNIFNWTQPTKTLPFYLAIVGIWILTICIPGRYLILAIGLSEFLYEFTPQPEVLPVKTRCVATIDAPSLPVVC
jgi:hypothetical protein